MLVFIDDQLAADGSIGRFAEDVRAVLQENHSSGRIAVCFVSVGSGKADAVLVRPADD